jgi:hypothetical protein
MDRVLQLWYSLHELRRLRMFTQVNISARKLTGVVQFQYSASVSSNGCGGSTAISATTISATAVTATTLAPITSTTVAITVSTSATTSATGPSSSGTPPTISSDATCQKMYTTCIAQVDQNVANPWAVEACVLGATCFGGQRPVDGFLATVKSFKNPNGATPASLTVPRVSTSLLSAISTDGKDWTQQNFVRCFPHLDVA